MRSTHSVGALMENGPPKDFPLSPDRRCGTWPPTGGTLRSQLSRTGEGERGPLGAGGTGGDEDQLVSPGSAAGVCGSVGRCGPPVWIYSEWIYSVWIYSEWIYSVWIYSEWIYSVWIGVWAVSFTRADAV
ncbi:unnamed protein product [Gadus morhua 'NCC']